MDDVIFSRVSLNMNLWITCHNNTEIISILFPNELNKLSSVSEPIFNWFPVLNSKWRVSSESKDIAYTILLWFIKSFNNFFTGHACTSQMHQYIKTHILYNVTTELQCFLHLITSLSPSNIHPEWICCSHSCNSINKIFSTYVIKYIYYLRILSSMKVSN